MVLHVAGIAPWNSILHTLGGCIVGYKWNEKAIILNFSQFSSSRCWYGSTYYEEIMTVGIISAIPEEYSKLEWDSEPRTETIINKLFQFGKINGVDVVAAECGIGKVNAAMTTALLLGHFGCSSIAFSGVAGGVNPKFKIGDVIIAEQLIQHDYGSIVEGQLISAIQVFPH